MSILESVKSLLNGQDFPTTDAYRFAMWQAASGKPLSAKEQRELANAAKSLGRTGDDLDHAQRELGQLFFYQRNLKTYKHAPERLAKAIAARNKFVEAGEYQRPVFANQKAPTANEVREQAERQSDANAVGNELNAALNASGSLEYAKQQIKQIAETLRQ